MANEITITTEIRSLNGLIKYNGEIDTRTFDQATARAGGFTVDVGTTEESISFGDIAPGFVRLTNSDATNFVEVGFSTGVYGATLLKSGGVMLFYRKSGTTVYVKADTATCKVQVEAINA
jgi:hypothetical protein